MELRYCEKCGDVIRVETVEPLNPADHFVCDGCKSGEGSSRRSKAASPADYEESLRQEGLNLFSPGTIAVRKKELEELAREQPKPKLKLVKSAAEAAGGGPAPSRVDSARVKSGRKLLFRCLHCRSTLAIRAVEKTSKLVCPHCSKSLFVTPAGRLHKNPPSSVLRKTAEATGSARVGAPTPTRTPSGRTLSAVAGGSSRRLQASGGSSAVRHAGGSSVARATGSSAVRRAGPGSSAVRRAGSSAVRRKSEPAGAAQPQTPLYLDGVPLDPTQPAYPSAPDAPLLPGSDLAPESLESSHPEGLDGFGQLEESFSPDSFEGEPTDDGFPDTESCEDSSFEPERSEPATAPQVAKPKPRRAGGRSVAFFVSVLQGVCLLACLGGPIFLAGGFSSLPASAESALKSPVPPRVLEQAERLGQQGLRGLRHLMGAQAE